MPESPITTRDATDADIPAVTVILNALIETTAYEWTEITHTEADRLDWLRKKRAAGDPVVVASEGERVMGVASFGDFRDATRWPGYRFTVEHSIHVAESDWGRGVGRALLSTLAEQARACDKRVMVAAIDASNVRSIEFHARLGFDEVARMPGVGEKFGLRRDLVLMQCELARAPW
jgi:L-amino acid N-acyltransferase